MRSIHRSLLVLLALLAAVAASPAAGARERSGPVRVGVLAKRGAEQCRARWEPTVRYLAERIPEFDFALVPLDFDEIHPAVAGEQVDFVLANSSFYVDLEVTLGARRIATLENLSADGSGQKVFAGVLFTRADRADLRDIPDLAGQHFMAVDERSLGGWHMQWRELLRAGFDPHEDFASLSFGGSHDAVVQAVLAGEVDAGGVRSDTLERMAQEGRISLSDLRVISPDEACGGALRFLHSTPHYPEWPMARTRHVPDDIAKRVTTALLQMPAGSAAARAAKVTGWAPPENYQNVRECLQELRLPPYDHHGEVTVGDALRELWPWISGAVVLLAGLFLAWRRGARLQNQLRRSEEKAAERARAWAFLQQILDSLPVGVLLIDGAERRIRMVNPEAAGMIGRARDEILGEPSSRFVCGVAAGECPLHDLGREWDASEQKLLTAERGPIPILKTAVRVEIDGADFLLETFLDLSERRALEQQHHHAQKMETLGRLAGGLAHDYNNMVGVILGFADLILEEPDLSDEVRGRVRQIRQAAERASRLTRQMLGFARKQTTAPEIFDPNRAIEDLLKMVKLLLGKSVELAWSPGAEVWAVEIDPSQFDQILVNLCVNARDAVAGRGRVVIATENVLLEEAQRAEFRDFEPGDFVVVRVRDDGVGMSPETLDKVFEPFFTTKKDGKGTGLGLATVYGIVKQNGGFIHIESEPGRGTCVSIHLPRR